VPAVNDLRENGSGRAVANTGAGEQRRWPDSDRELPALDGAGTTAPPTDERGLLLAEISNAVVRIHKRAYGKGPIKARAHLTRDLLTVVLEGGFTRAEQTLHRHGHSQQVIDSRLAIERAIENELRAAVETILYRAIRSSLSAPDPTNELQVEVFVLQPQGSEKLGAANGSMAFSTET
jgi:uncharacterized protein YbcI